MEKKSLSQQTADRLYTMIVVEHRLSPGEKLPSEVELARELGISQGTVSHHLNVLVRDEFIRINKDGSRLRCSLNQAAIENMIDDIRRLLL